MYDLIIIGAGPAGLTAALYAGRSRVKTLLLEKMAVGGRILTSETIENYPGFASITSHELMQRMEEQVKALDIHIKPGEVLDLDCKTKTVKVDGTHYSAQAVIIATGAKPRKLGAIGEERLTGRGVSYCATCDAPFFKGKDVVVVGGGNTVAEEAIYLSRFAKNVTIIHRRNELRASAILQEKLKENKKIGFILNSVLEEINGKNSVESIKLINVDSAAESHIGCEGVFIYIGYDPDTSFIKCKIKLDESGFIITDDAMQTSEEGIFACGDCRKKPLYQVITACADGAIAAESAYKYIARKAK
ncbi:MAG: thioredoxin-disulfide reductase [Candidatus Omnitrophota bacterium]|jgi:thioredoxin reductase (NADPH)